MCITCMSGAHRGQKRMSGLLGLELETVERHPVDVGNYSFLYVWFFILGGEGLCS